MDNNSTFDSVFRSRAETLAKMMDASDDGKESWTAEDLGAILEHQLSVAVEASLSAAGQASVQHVLGLAAGASPAIKTFRDLLQHPRPPRELLELTKRSAKQCRNCPNSLLPDEVATVLYFLSIVTALTQCRASISGLDTRALQSGLEWVLEQNWLSEEIRELFREGSRYMNAGH
jgi:hypothetical protein